MNCSSLSNRTEIMRQTGELRTQMFEQLTSELITFQVTVVAAAACSVLGTISYVLLNSVIRFSYSSFLIF